MQVLQDMRLNQDSDDETVIITKRDLKDVIKNTVNNILNNRKRSIGSAANNYNNVKSDTYSDEFVDENQRISTVSPMISMRNKGVGHDLPPKTEEKAKLPQNIATSRP